MEVATADPAGAPSFRTNGRRAPSAAREMAPFRLAATVPAKVGVARDGEQAIRRLADPEFKPDLIILLDLTGSEHPECSGDSRVSGVQAYCMSIGFDELSKRSCRWSRAGLNPSSMVPLALRLREAASSVSFVRL